MPIPSRGPGSKIRSGGAPKIKAIKPPRAGKSAVSVKARGPTKTVRAPGTRISLINRG